MVRSPTRTAAQPASPEQGGHGLSHSAIKLQLEKILASESFREAAVTKRFLRYAVEHTLSGEGDRLKEYRLGLEVFDRDSSFEPRLDPVVRMAARRLRVKLREYYETEGKDDALYIEVPKGGYAATFGSQTARSRRVHERSIRQRYSPWILVTVALLFVAVVAVLYRLWELRQKPASVPSQSESLAVLPFLNLTGDPDNEYLSDGLTDELTGALSRLSRLRVIARTSAFKFKGRQEDVRSIGSQLDVSCLLEGSLQKNGARLRVTVQLVRTSDGSHIWAQTYDPTPNNTFAMEDEITEFVTKGMQGRLVGGQLAARRTADPQARDLYLRGRYWWNRRTPPAVWKSVAYFNQALEKDPLYADAYLGLADAYTVLGFNDQAAANEVVPKARAAAEQALNLDNSLSEAHADLAASLLFHDWDFKRSGQEFETALALNPNHATGHQWYGLQLMFQRKFDAALQEFLQAQRLDPLSVMITLDVGQVHYYSGDLDAAIALAQKVLAQDPDSAMGHDLLGMAYERERRFPEALREFQTYVKLSGDDPDSLMRLAVTYAHNQKSDEALALARRIEKVPEGTYVPSYNLAVIYAALGEKERALQWLRRAVAEHASSCLLFVVDPSFETLHTDPRFQELARNVSFTGPE
jgi:TolB-like protein/Tfp pilus assembly protein PilF